MARSLIIFVILTSELVILSTSACNVPPDLWCDSYEIAQRCNVVNQCETFKRDRNPITVTLMYEALCPFCQRFITNHLGNLYNQFRGDVEIELIPWGNSRLLRNGQISCNHGQKECDANRLMSCAIDIVKVKQALPFVICLERALATQNVDQAMHHCSGFIRNQYRAIQHCYTSERGQQLQRQAAHKTMNVRAHPIMEVPYILINNYSPSIQANNLSITSLTQLIQKWINLKRPSKKF
uniref:Saposin A-type domain-containing protein n=1 Tax=Acrobeloides nanus TaxID=290746 RepID=A0A914EQW4_9BILA